MRIFFLRICCVSLVVSGLFTALIVDRQRHELSMQSSGVMAAQLMTKHDVIQNQDRVITDQGMMINEQTERLEEQDASIARLESILSEAIGQEYKGQPLHKMKVLATAYTARKEECNNQPWITASGTPSRVGVIAVSRDIEKAGIKLGDLVIVKDMGLFRVEDRMNKRWTKRIDILHANLEAARKFAKREVELMWLGKVDDERLAQNMSVPSG